MIGKKIQALLISAALATTAMVQAAQNPQELRLQRLERRVGHITELMLEVQALKRTNRQLQGQVEELQHKLGRVERKQRELYLDLDERLSRLQSSPASGAAPAAAPSTAAEPAASLLSARPSAAPPSDPAKEKADYDAAYALLQPSQRRYKEAIAAFKAFLDRYPGSGLRDNALYWLGEAHYVNQDNKAALAVFEQLIQQHPQSDKVPGALLKKGYILDAMGKRSEAKKALQQVVDNYPSASVSRMAKARLKHMSK